MTECKVTFNTLECKVSFIYKVKCCFHENNKLYGPESLTTSCDCWWGRGLVFVMYVMFFTGEVSDKGKRRTTYTEKEENEGSGRLEVLDVT